MTQIQQDTDGLPNIFAFIIFGFLELQQHDNVLICYVEQVVKIFNLCVEMSTVSSQQVAGIETYLVFWRGLPENLAPQVNHLKIGFDSSLKLCDRFGMLFGFL